MSKRKHIAMSGTLVTFIGLVLSGCTLESGEARPEQDDVEKIVWNHQESGCNARDAYGELLELGVAGEAWEVYGGTGEKKVTTISSRHQTSEETVPVLDKVSKDGVEMCLTGNKLRSREKWEVVVDGKPYVWTSSLDRTDVASCTYTLYEVCVDGGQEVIHTAIYDVKSGKVDCSLIVDSFEWKKEHPLTGTFQTYSDYLAAYQPYSELLTKYDFLATGEELFDQATTSNLEEYGDSLPGGIWYMFRERMEGGN